MCVINIITMCALLNTVELLCYRLYELKQAVTNIYGDVTGALDSFSKTEIKHGYFPTQTNNTIA